MSSRLRRLQRVSASASANENGSDSTIAKVGRVLGKPIASAAVAYAIAYGMGQAQFNVPFFGKLYSLPIVMGLVVGGGNLVANNISEWVIDSLSEYKALSDWEKSIATPLITAGGALGLLYLGDGAAFGLSGFTAIVGSALLSLMGGDYLYNNWIGNFFL